MSVDYSKTYQCHNLSNIYLIDKGAMLDSKRQKIHREVVSKQRQMIFKNRRSELLDSLQSDQTSQQKMMNPVKALEEKVNSQLALKTLITELSLPWNKKYLFKCIDDGIVHILIAYLQDGVQITLVFEVICLIFQKYKFYELDKFFYFLGVIEHAFHYFNTSSINRSFCIRILYAYAARSYHNCEVLYKREIHLVLIEKITKRFLLQNEPKLDNSEDEINDFYENALRTLEKLLPINLKLELHQQRLLIFKFALQLVEKQLFLKITLRMLNECVRVLDRSILDAITPPINQILTLAKVNDNYLLNLFKLIVTMINNYNLVKFNFNRIFQLGAFSKIFQEPLLQILEIQIIYKRFDFIPHDQKWWRNLLLPGLNIDAYCMILRLISKLRIQSEWIWKVFAEGFEKKKEQVQNEMIDILYRRLARLQQDKSVIKDLQKQWVQNILQKVSQDTYCSSIKNEAIDLLNQILKKIDNQRQQMI